MNEILCVLIERGLDDTDNILIVFDDLSVIERKNLPKPVIEGMILMLVLVGFICTNEDDYDVNLYEIPQNAL